MRNMILLGLVLCAGWAHAEAAEGGAVVEGVMTKHGAPLKNETVTLMRQRRDYKSWETQTDSSGHYRFKNITPGEYTVGYTVEIRRKWSNGGDRGSTANHARTFFVEAGESEVQVPPQAEGHTLRGKMIAPENCPIKIAWQGGDIWRLSTAFEWPAKKPGQSDAQHDKAIEELQASKKYKDAARKSVFLVPDVRSDGSFVVRDVPPGQYELVIEVGNDDTGDARGGVAFTHFKMPNKDFELPPLTVKVSAPPNAAK